jgi:DNA helicase-2/ATP-dependent DNA helicase PcrA
MTDVYGPAQLARLLGLPEPTPEQAAVIAAPLRPGLVVAGAGSGKSETMAARVVWLVANGHVRPEQVLGLTFTRKAAAELAERVRKRLDQLRGAGVVPDDVLDGEPTVATYNAYATRLVGDHALREAIEPTTRIITPAIAWQFVHRVVSTYDGPMDAVTSAPPPWCMTSSPSPRNSPSTCAPPTTYAPTGTGSANAPPS